MRIPTRVFAWCACAAFAACGFAADPVPTARLDVVAQPEGVQVWVDGVVRGTAGATPCTIPGLLPGFHHVRVAAAGRETADEIVKLGAGEYARRSFALAVEKGLVLVKTTPSGADVKCGGVSLGTTPLLLTTLAAGESHDLELTLNGHRAKRVRVRTEGRRPLVVEEALPLDSGILKCVSEPAGATVVVNGVERGVTPVEVRNVPRGQATVTFRLKGYRDETRDQLHVVAGDVQTLAVKLKGQAARLTVVSAPEGARVFVDDDYQGKTPVTTTAFMGGRHKVRIELAGHAPAEREITLENGGESTEEFSLQSVLGRIEVVTTPPGAKILVDGKAVGTTRSQGGDAARSQILALENIPAGDHSVVARLDGHHDVARNVVVKARDTGRLFLKLARIFTADTEVETVAGIHRGVLVEKDVLGNITLETSPGVRRTFRREDIRKVTAILK